MTMIKEELILQEWLRDKLTNLLDFVVPDEMINLIINKKSNDELEKYLRDLLNLKDPRTRPFIDELIKRRRTFNFQPVEKKKPDIDGKYQVSCKKNKVPTESCISFDGQTKKVGNSTSAGNECAKKKSSKFKNVPTKDPGNVLLKGRYCCNCEARKHKLINNCLTCGRIVCEQEGSGPCYVCDDLVYSPEEAAQFKGDTGPGSILFEKLLTREKPKGLDDALKHRDRLLEFDKNTMKHTHVFDDDSDYFCSTNPWLTLEERDMVKKREEEFFQKKNESRLNKKVNLIFQGNKVKQEETKESRSCLENSEESYDFTNPYQIERKQEEIENLIDPFFKDVDIKFKKFLKPNNAKTNLHNGTSLSHIMDAEIHQMTDEGYCLSIHQPWASFLVHGIRNVEGRTWYTSYRGKLWIASTGFRVPPQDIEKYMNTYRLIKEDVKFPADYPPSSLLGCADLLDCLTQEQYRAEYPDGEVEDPYVFIFENQRPLPVRYPIKGKPSIYKLDDKIHKAAVVCLKTTGKIMSRSEHRVKQLRP